jgi:hypothetical protein
MADCTAFLLHRRDLAEVLRQKILASAVAKMVAASVAQSGCAQLESKKDLGDFGSADIMVVLKVISRASMEVDGGKEK